ncbi:MAG: GUN4 domain-containing protein [Coleofasciculus sp. G1-WW12-02]|uniref:GUN4 domain-containing protein n=1 Tax=Coleofasciculus sp. G1-WW12-02 TaxID=3068483 RepID=UPI0032F38CBB
MSNHQSQPEIHKPVIKLRSEKGVDYTVLQTLLADEKWKEADMKTNCLMRQAAGNEGGYVWLNRLLLQDLPCEDLRIIDQLWLYYSKGKWGFRVQMEIYHDLGGKIDVEVGQRLWGQFSEQVGWSINDPGNWEHSNLVAWQQGDSWPERICNLNAPRGHFPLWCLPTALGFPKWGLNMFYFAEKLVTCEIGK